VLLRPKYIHRRDAESAEKTFSVSVVARQRTLLLWQPLSKYHLGETERTEKTVYLSVIACVAPQREQPLLIYLTTIKPWNTNEAKAREYAILRLSGRS
jgi:hypothetical protein